MSGLFAGLRAVLRDPLYRWEVRRYWTWRRYLLLGGLLLLIGGVYVAYGAMLSMELHTFGEYPPNAGQWCLLAAIFTLSSGRVVFCLLAAIGAALAVAPERVAGQLESLVITPLDPERFLRTRFLGRFRGIFIGWIAVGAGAAAMSLLGWLGGGFRQEHYGPLRVMWRALALDPAAYGPVMLLGMIDLGVTVLLDTAVGLRFSASSRSTGGAVAKTCLVSFVLLPLVLNLPGSFLVQLLVMLEPEWLRDEGLIALWPVVQLLIHLGLATLFLWLNLRWARRAVNRIFLEPEDAK